MLATIVRATQVSARATDAMSRWSFVMTDLARKGKLHTPQHAQASVNYCRAASRYRNAQKVLRLNPLPGDEKA